MKIELNQIEFDNYDHKQDIQQKIGSIMKAKIQIVIGMIQLQHAEWIDDYIINKWYRQLWLISN